MQRSTDRIRTTHVASLARPASSANRTIRSATVSGCSTMLVAWLMTPGSSTASRGGRTRSMAAYSTCSASATASR